MLSSTTLVLFSVAARAAAAYSPAFFWSPHSPASGPHEAEHLAAMSSIDVEHMAALLAHGRKVHLVFLAQGLTTEAVRQHGGRLPALDRLLKESSIALTVPFTTAHDADVFAAAAHVPAASAEQYFKTRASLLASGVTDTVVVELPAAAGAAPEAQLEAHDAVIERVTRAVDAGTGGDYAALLTAARRGAARGTARRLTAPEATPPPYLHTTPTLLTAQLVMLLLMVIFLSGFCCLFSLQTPKRFEDTSKAQ